MHNIKNILLLALLLSFLTPFVATPQVTVDSKTPQDVTSFNGFTVYAEITLIVQNLSMMSSDTLWFADNFKTVTITIDSIKATSDLDNQDVTLCYRDWNTNSARETLDSFTITTDGTDGYYHSETTLTDGSWESGESLGFVNPSISSTQLKVTICCHYSAVR